MSLDDFSGNGSSPTRRHPDTFERTVRADGPWPNPPAPGSRQLANLAGVLYRLRTRVPGLTIDAFKHARDAEARLVRRADGSLGYEYWKTIHANCVRDLGYEGEEAVADFVADAERFLGERA